MTKSQNAAPVADPGTKAADHAAAKIEKRIGAVYGQAKTEMEAELKKLKDDYGPKLSWKHQQLMNGEITKEQYDSWIRMQVLREEILRKKIEQCSAIMLHANQKAVAIVNGETMNVFAENANFQSYQITQDTGMNLSFAVYDEKTVERLIKDRPELLPRKVVNGKKDKAWNQTKIANSVTAAILKGESIPDLAKRIARETSSTNGSAMVRYARTAMTSAQNAGRMEGLHRAKDMGIKVKKRWLATLDSRTRDAHADLDGQTVDVDEPFMSALGPIMYPGDPSADPANVYNCRCTLVYEYEGYPDAEDAERIAAEHYRDEDDNLRSRPAYVKNMSYNEWKKSAQEQSEPEESRYSFRNMPRSMETDKYEQWVKSHSTRAIAKEDEQLLNDLWMAESNPGGIHYVQSADGSSAINGYWRNDGAITYAGKWDRTVRPGDKVPSKLQAAYERDSKSIRETSEAMDRLIQFGRSDREMALERWSGADALKRLGIDIGSGKTQRFGHARITDGLNHQDIVDQINQTLKGAVISDKGYSSASVSSERNVFIGSDIKFTIIAPEGTPMYITENTAESEVILARKTEMEVIGARVIDTKARRNEWNGETTEKETKTVEILVKLLQ